MSTRSHFAPALTLALLALASPAVTARAQDLGPVEQQAREILREVKAAARAEAQQRGTLGQHEGRIRALGIRVVDGASALPKLSGLHIEVTRGFLQAAQQPTQTTTARALAMGLALPLAEIVGVERVFLKSPEVLGLLNRTSLGKDGKFTGWEAKHFAREAGLYGGTSAKPQGPPRGGLGEGQPTERTADRGPTNGQAGERSTGTERMRERARQAEAAVRQQLAKLNEILTDLKGRAIRAVEANPELFGIRAEELPKVKERLSQLKARLLETGRIVFTAETYVQAGRQAGQRIQTWTLDVSRGFLEKVQALELQARARLVADAIGRQIMRVVNPLRAATFQTKIFLESQWGRLQASATQAKQAIETFVRERIVSSESPLQQRLAAIRAQAGERLGQAREQAKQKLGELKEVSQQRLAQLNENVRVRWAEVQRIFGELKTKTGELLQTRPADLGLGKERVQQKVAEARQKLTDLRLKLVEDTRILVDHSQAKVIAVSTGFLASLKALELPMRARMIASALSRQLGRVINPAKLTAWKNAIFERSTYTRIGQEALARGRAVRDMIRERLAANERPLGQRLRAVATKGVEKVRGILDRYRRPADRTVQWKKVLQDRVLPEAKGFAAGAAHFGLALFLKEFGMTVASNNPERMDEFFDFLLSTDFFIHYGQFMIGAGAADLAYRKFLDERVRSRFANQARGIQISNTVKNSLAVAVGMAIPDLANGTFDGRTYMVSLSALGLSQLAVSQTIGRIPWVQSLHAASAGSANTLKLGRLSLVGKAARFTGWVYTAAELAIVLVGTELIAKPVLAAMDLADAKQRVADAAQESWGLLLRPGLDAQTATQAVRLYGEAWNGYREYLYRPVFAREAKLAEELQGAASKAKRGSDVSAAIVQAADVDPELARYLAGRGSAAGYAEGLVSQTRGNEFADQIAASMQAFDAERSSLLQKLYEENVREGEFLRNVSQRSQLLSGRGRGSLDGIRRDFVAAHKDASENRLQTYRDQGEGLTLLLALARLQGSQEVANAVELGMEQVRQMHMADQNVYESLIDGGTRALSPAVTVGAVGRLGGVGLGN